MPWQSRRTVDLRTEFIDLYASGQLSMSELCRRFQISRKTGYKWLRRYHDQGIVGLEDQSRVPCSQPLRTDESLESLILACRERYPDWGGRKLKRVLENEGYQGLPAPSTITEILRRQGQLRDQRHERRAFIRFEHPFPNDLWQMDFKGHFRVGGGRCHPLTVLDDCSRYSLCLQACADEQTPTVQAALTHTFERYGLPRRMTMDNGTPWGGGGFSRFSRLTVWLIEQGIAVGHSTPYHPQTQGKDERFHQTLAVELLGRREFDSMRCCQQAFHTWRQRYNQVRPHEALDMATPASRYEPSLRSYQPVLPAYEYGPGDQVRKVAQDETVSFMGYRVSIGQPFIGKRVAIRPTLKDGCFTLHFCHQQIGMVNLRELTKSAR